MFTYIFTIFAVIYSFLEIQIFFCNYFPSAWGVSFTISYHAGLLAMNLLSMKFISKCLYYILFIIV